MTGDSNISRSRHCCILGDPGAVSRDETRIGTGAKFSSKARRAPGNISLTDEFQSELNSDFLIGRKFPQLSLSIREPHIMTSDRDSLYEVIDTTSTVAIFFYRSPCLARKTQTDIPCSENLGHKGTRKMQNSTNSTSKILLRGGNYLYMCKIKMLGQNTLEEPTRLLQGKVLVVFLCSAS